MRAGFGCWEAAVSANAAVATAMTVETAVRNDRSPMHIISAMLHLGSERPLAVIGRSWRCRRWCLVRVRIGTDGARTRYSGAHDVVGDHHGLCLQLARSQRLKIGSVIGAQNDRFTVERCTPVSIELDLVQQPGQRAACRPTRVGTAG